MIEHEVVILNRQKMKDDSILAHRMVTEVSWNEYYFTQ